MGLILTNVGQPAAILKTTGVAWTAINGTEQVSVVIPIAYEEGPATRQEAAGIIITISSAISAGTTDGNLTFSIYTAADNSTKDTVATVTNTIAYLVANTPHVQTFTYRMDEVGPAIILGITRATGDRVFAAPTVTARRWYYKQIIG